jgi:Potential Queuosine, Q, salvage protein family
VGEVDPVPERVRSACAWVAGRAQAVRIDERALGAYVARAGLTSPRSTDDGVADLATVPPSDPAAELVEGDRETLTTFVLCLDAINFGSGWWPTIRKRPGHSGYFTIAAGLTERFRDTRPWTAAELAGLEVDEVAAVFGQDPEHPLMADYAAALRNVGQRVGADHSGRFEAVVEAAAGSAVALAGLLAGWQAFADTSTYEGRQVPFFKRAQIAAADIGRMGLGGERDAAPAGPGGLRDLDRLTAFADNLVPHVLRVDGVLRLDPALEAKIEAGELLEHGSAEEVELRACAVHAIEQLATAAPLSPAEIDGVLWNRGAAPRYKSLPRPRSRNTAY